MVLLPTIPSRNAHSASFLLTVSDFDKIVGLKYLRGMHLNDSKATLASKKDRHENIGLHVLS